MRTGILIPTVIALAVIWSGVAIVMHETEEYIITPEKILVLVKQAPWLGGKKPSAQERAAFLDKVVTDINKLDFAQKGRLWEEGRNATEDFVFDLTDAERKTFIARTVEQRFQPVMNTIKAMGVEERRKVINAARADMRKNGRSVDALDGLVKENDQAFEEMIQHGIGDYYKAGSEKRKMQLAPLLEELQIRLQGGRRR